MRVLTALAFMPSVLAAALSPIPIDSRSLSDIYAAAQKESGVLRVVHGGDGTYFDPWTDGIDADLQICRTRPGRCLIRGILCQVSQRQGEPHR